MKTPLKYRCAARQIEGLKRLDEVERQVKERLQRGPSLWAMLARLYRGSK